MTLSLLGASLPFPVLKTFELERSSLVPATYSRARTQQDKQSFLIVTSTHLIRITEQCDGWRAHTKKEMSADYVKACSILTDDTVLVANA